MATEGPRRTLGVLVSQLEDAYQSSVWTGIQARAQARGFGVTCFVGPGFGSPDVQPPQGTLAFAIAAPPAFDGLIILSTSIGPVPESCARLPRVSLGQKLPGVPTLTVDGRPGIEELVRHLVRDHGRRRFALITGPDSHVESAERTAAVRETLAAEGLELDERLWVRGSFYEASGAEGTRRLLATGIQFDVLMALNDRMAVGALQTLKDAGIRVPEQVSVTGFDNIDQGRSVSPPLTTVDQPLEAMGSLAVDLIADLLDGKAPRDRVLPCQPVRRGSCGCPPQVEDFWVPVPQVALAGREELAGFLARGDGPGFLSELARVLGASGLNSRQAVALVDALEDLAFPGQKGFHPLAEAGRRLAGESAAQAQAARRHAVLDQFAAVRNLSAQIAGAFGREPLLERLKEGWESVGVRSGYLVLFDAPVTDSICEFSRLVLPEGTRFPTRELLPTSCGHPWTRGSWILEPLVYQQEPLGYLLLEGTSAELSVYAALRDQVASTLKGTLLMESLKDHERSLEDQVAQRTLQLTVANDELTQEVNRRRDLERQVQEISDRTMRRIGQDLHDDLCQHLAGVAMLTSVVRRSLSNAPAGAGPALDQIGALLEDSIIRARHIARGLYPPGLEERGLADAVEELVATARLTSPALLVYETEGDCRGGDPERRLQMFRILQEALANALKHSGTDVVRVHLVGTPGGAITGSVTDFGPGLSPAPGTGGLGLGIMRHRAESAGLELKFEALTPGLRVVCHWPAQEKYHA